MLHNYVYMFKLHVACYREISAKKSSVKSIKKNRNKKWLFLLEETGTSGNKRIGK